MINKEDANILIVDDIEDNRYTLERRLKRDGYKKIEKWSGYRNVRMCLDYQSFANS